MLIPYISYSYFEHAKKMLSGSCLLQTAQPIQNITLSLITL